MDKILTDYFKYLKGGSNTNLETNDQEMINQETIDQATIDKYNNSIIIIVKNGLGNKLMTIINMIHKYHGKLIYFVEQTSHHQTKSLTDKIKYIFPNLNTNSNIKRMSWKLFDLLQKYGIKDVEYSNKIYYDISGFTKISDSTRKLLKMNSNYDYLKNNYDLNNGIFVHYRLGDKFELNYIELNKNKVCKYALFTPDYYIDSINKMLKEKKGAIYIMSDSIKVAECLLKNKLPNLIFINEGSAETFYLMTHCRRLIISESSMTVAAVYLNNNKPQVIVPNFLIDVHDNHKIIKNTYYSDEIVSFVNDKKYLLYNKEQYYRIYKQCYKINRI
jgi:hypothetical protein